MITDLFLRTYDQDAQWLPFLFRSLARHARDFRDLIVVAPPGSASVKATVDGATPLLLSQLVVSRVRLETCQAYEDDYNGQQVSKLRAWELSSADEVLYLDADLVVIQDLTPYTRRGLIEGRPWADVGDAVCWKEPTERLLGVETKLEVMARHPFQHPVQLVRRCYEHVGGQARLLSYPKGWHFSEFNLLGSYAHLIEGRSVMLSTDEDWQTDVVRQFRSYDGLTPEVEAELRRLGYWGEHHGP